MPDPSMIDLEGWELIESDPGYVTFIRGDRLAKITVKPVTFADHGDGWKATLWTKESPHGRSEYAADVAHFEFDQLTEQITALAEEAVDDG